MKELVQKGLHDMTAIKDHWCDSTHKKDFVKKEFPDKEPTNFILERIPWHKTFIQEKPSQYERTHTGKDFNREYCTFIQKRTQRYESIPTGTCS
jgi:hypothetical protein